MAVAFELVADFLSSEDDANRFAKLVEERLGPVAIDNFVVSLHPPLQSGYPYGAPTQFPVAVLPVNVGLCVALDTAGERLQLNESQIRRLGDHLYTLLSGLPYFKLAMVGWDVNFLLDIATLRNEWEVEIRNGSFGGLVVANDLLAKLPRSDHFTMFDDSHVWIPYLGSPSLNSEISTGE